MSGGITHTAGAVYCTAQDQSSFRKEREEFGEGCLICEHSCPEGYDAV
jgi:Pyruvate/2-oxoacid:ferredoxin oxidoreductase delta subunit